MLKLPNVTLLGMAGNRPNETIKAMLFSMRQVQFGAAVLVIDFKHRDLLNIANQKGIKAIHQPEGLERDEFEFEMIEKTHDFFETSYCLYQEWDAAVMNPSAWKNLWLGFDFIGAPWPIGAEQDFWWIDHPSAKDISSNTGRIAPPATEKNNVGNGGFALKSKAFCEFVASRVNRNDPNQLCSDAWICRTLRSEAEKKGFRYAPEAEAERFSCENRFYSGQFGLHGKNTIKMNNFDWGFNWL